MSANALIVVDMQNDFTPATDRKPAGALAVPQGNDVVPLINSLMDRFDLVVATQDWHPPDHLSFASQHPGRKVGEVIELDGLTQVLWPDHCVQETPGAAFVPDLETHKIDHVVRKGTDRHIDSYSAFFDNGRRKATNLARFLRERDIANVYVAGLATDYCVKATALDARRLGFNVYVVRDACRAVNLKPTDEEEAIQAMREAGAKVMHSSELPSTLPAV
ncbi:MAG TPA: bifunctional nicotinamidase/pyrazinamidase [Phycisphaeraceae bacterium]